MNERTIQIDVIGKIEGTQFMIEYNQYFHRKKLILKTKKNDYG